MSPIHNKLAYGAFSVVAVAFIALTLFPIPQPGKIEILDVPHTPSGKNAQTGSKQNKDDREMLTSVLTDLDQAAARPETETIANLDPNTEAKQDLGDASTAKAELEEAVVAYDEVAESSADLAAGSAPNATTSVSNTPQLARPSVAPSQANSANRTGRSQAQMKKMASPQSMAYSAPEPTSAVGVRERRAIAVSDAIMPSVAPQDREEYAKYEAHSTVQVKDQPVSTFSIDVDTASYSLVRNQLNNGFLPKPTAVRAEEFINYFDYNYSLPKTRNTPFAPSVTVLASPWNEGRKLVHIGIKGLDIEPAEQPDSNIVFLLDVSGSMNQANKLPLVKQSMALLLETLKPTDLISIVVYAGAAGVVLEPTAVKEQDKILSALQQLQAGGSTAGGAGIRRAYQLAEANFKGNGVNRIILATDGDFNVGQSSNEDLKTLVERKRDNGVFLSVLGFGRNNYQDDMMQTLAQNGNGIAAYIDTLSEAKKVLVDEATSTLFPIAKDVKIQVEFNPATVSEYRLIGYETRALKREDFNNDKVDAGDIGAGHTVTAIYEITPANSDANSVDGLRYQQEAEHKDRQAPINSSELGFLKMRYKLPNETKSRLIETPIKNSNTNPSQDVQFSIAVAGFAQLLTNSPLVADLNYDDLIREAQASKGDDPFGYRAEFIQLVRMAKVAKP